MTKHESQRGISPAVLTLSVLLALLAGGGAGLVAGRLTAHGSTGPGASGRPARPAPGSTDGSRAVSGRSSVGRRSSAGSIAGSSTRSGGTPNATPSLGSSARSSAKSPPTGSAATQSGSAASRSARSGASRSGTAATTARPALVVTSIAPADGSTAVPATSRITVTFSAAPAAGSAVPSVAPSTPGAWQVVGDSLTFTPSAPFVPLSQVSVTVPGGRSGVHAQDGATLDQSVVDRFRIEDGSVLRLQQLLSLLDYSPLAFRPSPAEIPPTDTSAQLAALYHPPGGSFTWREKGWPARLLAMWHPGTFDVFTKGLVMSFQADHGIAPDGAVGPETWAALLQAWAQHDVNTGGYDYALADKTPPETLSAYHDGRLLLRSRANTGIAGSPTPDGTFPVYTRLRRQVMRGTNPDGTHYADLVQYIAYFHGNDAVHYMPRAGYGIPQSLGCIELPLADAARVWPYLAYGTLVTVVG